MSEIKKNVFYGKELLENHANRETKLKELSRSTEFDPPRKRQRLLDPSEFWSEHRKQDEALNEAHRQSLNSLHTFVFQDDQGYRKFIVAHPQVYWQKDELRPPSQRCSYEVKQKRAGNNNVQILCMRQGTKVENPPASLIVTHDSFQNT